VSAPTALDLACPPRWATRRTPERPTLGPRVAEIAEALGKPFMPHQRLICDVAFELDPKTGYLAYDEVIVIGPRQTTGKTELMLPVMTHRCVGFGDELAKWVKRELGHDVQPPGPQRVLYTAQTASKAAEKWRDIHVERLQKSPFASMVDVRLRLNMEAIMWPNGSSWSPGATTGRTGGTGDTLDLAVIDESWSREDNRTELGLRPAMLTRNWRQLWQLSMIPGISRALPGRWPYLHAKRQMGRAMVEGDHRQRVAFFEWSAERDADPSDPRTWWTCMPGLGRTAREEAVRSDFEALDLVDFCAEYLGWEPAPGLAKWGVISEAAWLALAVRPARGAFLDPVAFGVDGQPDQSGASIGMAALTPDGDTHVELVEKLPGVTWVVPAMVKLCQKQLPCAVGIAAHGPVASLIEPMRRAFAAANVDCPIVTFQGPDVAQACAQVYSETGQVDDGDVERSDRRLRHIDQPELNASVAGATKYTFGDQWRWARTGPGGDASPLNAVTMARAAGERVEWLGGSYDIADSLG
jgi:hypothetical protein